MVMLIILNYLLILSHIMLVISKLLYFLSHHFVVSNCLLRGGILVIEKAPPCGE